MIIDRRFLRGTFVILSFINNIVLGGVILNYKSTRHSLSALLIVITLFSSWGTAFGATVPASSGINGHWAQNEITEWIDKGFIQGYADGSFQPDNSLKRTEFMALINRSFGFTETAAIAYTDITSSNWAYAEVAKAVKAGYITGYPDGTIGAGNSISRQEAAVIISRLMKLDTLNLPTTTFSDSNTIAPWAKDAVQAVVAAGIIKGYPADHSFKPSKNITRAEAVVSLKRTIVIQTDSNSKATPAPSPTSIVTPTPTIKPTSTPTSTGTPTSTETPTATATPSITPTPAPTATPEPLDTVPPILTRVTSESITVGDNVYGTSNEDGYLYLVPSTTVPTKPNLDDSVNLSLGKKIAVTASVYSSVNTKGLPSGTYVVYAVDSSENLSIASSSILVKGIQLSIDKPSSLTETKMYDGTTKAEVKANTLTGVLEGDFVEVHASAFYNSAALGINKTITVVYSLSGIHAASYLAPVNYSIETGSITLTQLTIENPDLTLAKYKDGTTTAAVNAGLLIGVVSGEDVKVNAIANYDTSAVGTHKTITVIYTLSGVDAGNYIAPANYTVTSGEIDKDQITRSKVYDGTTFSAVTLGEVTGIIDGDDVTVNITATYDDSKVGTNKTITIDYMLSGEDAENYYTPASYTISTGTITALQLNITAPLITESKIYDGSTSTQVTPGQLIGVVPGDDVTVTAVATYNDASVGTNKIITIVYTLSGADAANYIAPTKYSVSTGTITAP
jgi:hypothetical protein